MKKSYAFNVMSNVRCHHCDAFLKRRMVEEHAATICWKCMRAFMRMWGFGRKKVLRRVK